MIRDMVEVPKVVEKCCTAIEDYGLEIVGIYRLSGTTSKIQKLKGLLERGVFPSQRVFSFIDIIYDCLDVDSVNLNTDEWRSDININNVTSVLKLWLRELPEPLLTFNLYQGFIDAASTSFRSYSVAFVNACVQKSRMIACGIFDCTSGSMISRTQTMPR
jgi:hypothetical protein